MKAGRIVVSVLTAVLVGSVAASADVILLDFGDDTENVFSGTYDGSSGFQAGAVLDAQPATPVFSLGGGRTLSFVNVGAYDLSGPGDLLLTGDFLYSEGAAGADDPVVFTLNGFSVEDTVTLEFLGSSQRGGLVTFNSVQTAVPTAAGSFVSVGTVSGSATYQGSFTHPDGVGEGNLSGARITFGAIPEPGTCAALAFGLVLLMFTRNSTRKL